MVIAVGSHEPDARELDSNLLARAEVVVEDIDTALREAGDVMAAIHAGFLRTDQLITMAEAVTGRLLFGPEKPLVFKSTGMLWQDLMLGRSGNGSAPGQRAHVRLVTSQTETVEPRESTVWPGQGRDYSFSSRCHGIGTSTTIR